MRLRLLVFLLISFTLLNIWLGRARGEKPTTYPWCVELSQDELVSAVEDWYCVYGGVGGFQQGDAPFLSRVWWHQDTMAPSFQGDCHHVFR
jgi:hypothetical protein